MRNHGLAIKVLQESTAMLYDKFMQVVQGGLSVSVDVRDDSAKDLRLVVGLGA